MANTIETPFMELTLPVPTVEIGPAWAIELNAAFELVDAHDHSSGKGVKITPAGINITSDLNFNNFRAFGLKSSKYTDQSSTLSGASNASSVYSFNGDLYWTNGSGVVVQITSGSSIISTPSSVDNFQFDNVASDLVIGPADNFVALAIDASAPRTITLPLASSVTPGRFYIIKDDTLQSETNNITILPSGSDTIDEAASDLINSDGGAKMYVGNGTDKWSAY